MAPYEDPEIANNRWETDSVSSIAPSVVSHQNARTSQQPPNPRNQASSRRPTSQTATSRDLGLNNQENIAYRRHGGSGSQDLGRLPTSTPARTPTKAVRRVQTSLKQQQQQQSLNIGSASGYPTSRIPTGYEGNSSNYRDQRSKARTSWATPPPLITTRQANLNDQAAAEKAEMARLRSKPGKDNEFSATGVYHWPKGSDPMKLFDPSLAFLDDLRKEYKVHIDWDDRTRCLRLNCIASAKVAVQNISGAIMGIRVRYKEAQAQIISASPIYIVVPPTTAAIRSIVQPEKTEHRHDSPHVITHIKLSGEPLAPAALAKWVEVRQEMNKNNYQEFRTHLFRRILELQHLRSWMRMRILFGHINLSQYQMNFMEGKFSFEQFADMMKKSRVATGGTFDRKFDALIVKNVIRKLVGRAQDFAPRKSTTLSLGDVIRNPRHTIIIFVQLPDTREYRLEAEIETVQSGAMGKYQIGHTRLFTSDGRNKRVEITTVDIESQFDWTIEISQDSERKEVPQGLRSYIAASLDKNSNELKDPVGLPYPAIALRAPTDFTVRSVVMRSIFQYQWVQTANVIEIAIYRDWNGFVTRPAPKMQASISMFNPDWDTEMDSIENISSGRKWDKQLLNFFHKEEDGKRSGLAGLLDEIREIQDLLKDAAADEAVFEDSAEECVDLQEPEVHETKEDTPRLVLREIHEADEIGEERRRAEVTEKLVAERQAATLHFAQKQAAILHYQHSMVSSSGLFFDDTPPSDGSLI